MKLMFCPKCFDTFKLVIFERRTCRCKTVQGQLRDSNRAVTNGQGIAVALDNKSLSDAIKKFFSMAQTRDEKFYKKHCAFTCWVRPHAGSGNPRTEVESEGDLPPDNTVDILYRAIEHFRRENPSARDTPAWLNDAERILKDIPRTG
jgi:hypothetical protein